MSKVKEALRSKKLRPQRSKTAPANTAAPVPAAQAVQVSSNTTVEVKSTPPPAQYQNPSYASVVATNKNSVKSNSAKSREPTKKSAAAVDEKAHLVKQSTGDTAANITTQPNNENVNPQALKLLTTNLASLQHEVSYQAAYIQSILKSVEALNEQIKRLTERVIQLDRSQSLPVTTAVSSSSSSEKDEHLTTAATSQCRSFSRSGPDFCCWSGEFPFYSEQRHQQLRRSFEGADENSFVDRTSTKSTSSSSWISNCCS
jgi:hypothetical protein